MIQRPLVDERLIRPRDGEWPTRMCDVGPKGLPTELQAQGRLLPPFDRSIAIVGTRRPTVTGLEIAQQLAGALVEAGFSVVSGLALGIDAAAHRGALEAGGHTVAVLGCGLDQDYPARNTFIRRQIETRGTVITEHPRGTEPKPFLYPRRNRVIVGLSRAVIVVEGGLRSGALITARIAIDANRDVFAVPGSPRNAMASGPNELIRLSEAALVTKVDDVFSVIAPGTIWQEPYVPGDEVRLDELEERVLHALEATGASVDQVARTIEQSVGEAAGVPKRGEVALTLARLELRGLARRTREGRYEITKAGLRVSLARSGSEIS